MNRYDVAIIGSGFSGSILAWILAARGRKVLLVDKAKHPRFAIGESSTPIADLMLAHLGDIHGLPVLDAMSSYGSWKAEYARVACGLKRGFSYFDHRHPTLKESFLGEKSLLVAASPSDQRGDTNWFRYEVDQFLFQQAVSAGVDGWEGCELTDVALGEPHRLTFFDGREAVTNDLIDASGRSSVLSRLLKRNDRTAELNTCTGSVYIHAFAVKSFSSLFDQLHSDRRATEPFDADDAAQHHLVKHGWVWMLRLGRDLTSIGQTLDWNAPGAPADEAGRRRLLHMVQPYSDSIEAVMSEARSPGEKAARTILPRVQHFVDPVISPTCWLLPTTALTLDPLHSTGIAHALIGVHRSAELLLADPQDRDVQGYRQDLMAEAECLDALVSMAYKAMHSFPRFISACMMYFAAAIASEERMLQDGPPRRFWLSDDLVFREALRSAQWMVERDSGLTDEQVESKLRDFIRPWNTAGLMDPGVSNRYAYTATK